MTNFEMVKEFMRSFGQEVKEKADFVDNYIAALRIKLIMEEAHEVCDAINASMNTCPDYGSVTFKEAHESKNDESLHEIAKELTDLLVVTYGAGAAYGIDLDMCFKEVHRSNMSKLGEDGKPIYRKDGKILKGPNYSPADLMKILYG
jgi:predicted HAD superfamily Cof-like phosphohydrolase